MNLYEDTHGDGCGCPADQTRLGEHPEFSPEELAEIRRLAANEWSYLHMVKNESDIQAQRDAFTERLLTLERIEEKTR